MRRNKRKNRSKKAKLDEDVPMDDINFGEKDSEETDKNIQRELCDYWKVQREFLLEMKKDLDLLGNDVINSKTNLHQIDCISNKALTTIQGHNFVPDDLVESVVLLNHLFPFITGYEEQNSVCNLIEHWWKLNLTWRQKVVTNSLIFLIEKSKTSLLHIKRLYQIKDALELLIDENNFDQVIQLVHQKYMLANVEGREIIAKLLSFGDTWIVAIHEQIKIAFESNEMRYVKAYAEIYSAAFENATEENKKILKQRCLRDFVFHALRSKRSSAGRDKLGRNLLRILEYFNFLGSLDFKDSIHELYNDLLWEHLKSSSVEVRCNAAEVLFVVVSMQNERESITNQHFLKEAYKVITELLRDENDHVCFVVINCILNIEWNNIPDSVVDVWIDGIISLTKNSDKKKLRIEILKGLKSVFSDTVPERRIQYIVKHLTSSIYVDNSEIRIAYLELLLHLNTNTNVKFWNIVPSACILSGVENSNGKILDLSMELLYMKLKSIENISSTVSEILRFGIVNQNGMRRFLLMKSKDMDFEMMLNLVEEILLTITEEAKKCLKDTLYETNVKILFVYLFEAASLLLYKRFQEISKEVYREHIVDIKDIVSNNADMFCCFIENSSTAESAILLLSFFPLTKNSVKIVKSCKNVLLNTNTSQVRIRIIDLFIKWKRLQPVFNLIIELCNGNIEKNRQLGLNILEMLLSEHFAPHLVQNHHEEMENFWIQMNFVKLLVEDRLIETRGIEHESVERLFKIYVSLIDVLHKDEVHSTSRKLSSLYDWAQSTVVPRMLKPKDPEFIKFPIAILKIIFEVSKTVISLDKVTPMLCCETILLYCKCLIAPNGIVFFNDALVAVLVLLKYYQTVFKDDDMKDDAASRLLVASMIALAQTKENNLLRHTNDLRSLEKFFQELISSFEDSTTSYKFMSIIFNTSVNCLGKELHRQLKAGFPLEHVKRNGFPYVTKRILSLIFDGGQLQELCLCTLDNLILNYKEIDELSLLLILQNRLENDGGLQRKIEPLCRMISTKKQDEESDETIKRLIKEAQANFVQTKE